ncbi:MAG: NADH:ubiquinone reductase (Na(+)-transporting) subunit D [Chitinophagaceae bacterium]|nr:MAG: NADH:ubiquinone reductase (Na(+)-transporting) subunit D [Chitinophagaceae bacterium]
MSTTAEKQSLFGKKERKLLSDPLDDNNPITVQVLGICSALAVTVALKPAMVMTLAVIAVMGFASLIISLLRKMVPSRVRIIVQITVIAFLVILVDQILKAFSYDVYTQLSVYIGLIITNCIVMGRLEAFAMGNKPWSSFLDGVGNGIGYGIILIGVAFFREFFGKGELFGWAVPYLSEIEFFQNGMMLTPAAAMFVIGLMIWWQRARNTKLVDIS